MNVLTIDQLRVRKYFGQLKIESTVKDEESFTSYIASYDSDGLKIYGYLVIPLIALVGKIPLIIFCHGRIEPKEYLPERQYARHCEYLASQGFVVFKPDYRGHGNSEGSPETIFESGYAVDVLNATSSLLMDSHFRGNDKEEMKIGIFGHSLGGNIVLKAMEVSSGIKAGVIWAGAVARYDEILSKWGKNNSLRPKAQELIQRYGEPKENPDFWRSISPINFVEYINGSILIQHGEKDQSIPTSQAVLLKETLEKAGKSVKLVLYKNGDHNLEGEIWEEAMKKSANFFAEVLE